MRKLTGTETAVMGVIHAIRKSSPSLMPPIGWPVEIEHDPITPLQPICKVKVTLPDLNQPGRSMAAVRFRLERKEVQGTSKYTYRVLNNRVTIYQDFPDLGDHFRTVCQYVTNTYAHDDDFVVPPGTPRETEIQLMQFSTRDLRHWISRNPLQLSITSRG